MASALSDTFATINESFVRMLDWNRDVFEKTMRATQEESLGFINRRLERNQRILESLRENESLANPNWFIEAAKDYVETSSKIRDRFFDVASQGVQQAAEQGKRNVESFRSSANDMADKSRRSVEAAQRKAAE